MGTLLIAIASFGSFLVAYHTYGRQLARKVFRLDPSATVPSSELEDGVDYVPTRKHIIFGHHFTSIAGTGPIVGPAIAVFWGWLPALLWVVFGSIFVGAVHDFGALVVSMRSRGQSIGDAAGRMISRRARFLFLLIMLFVLAIVIGVFGLVIALIFTLYPGVVLSVWTEIPIAVALGWWIYRRKGGLLWPSLGAVGALYLMVYIGMYFAPVSAVDMLGVPLFAGAEANILEGMQSAVVIWTLILLVYCFIASVLPVGTLLQPRDYINSHQLLVALVLLVLGVLVAHPTLVAPAVNSHPPADAPPLLPFLFITIACGAVSGFHSLVSSGTSSKQLGKETDAQFVGYGAMLMEAALAVLVILACSAGLGLGVLNKAEDTTLTGMQAWMAYYGGDWTGMTLGRKVGAFVEGGANMIAALGIPLKLAVGVIAVMTASFAATTIDTATRLQRYVVQEVGRTVGVKALGNKYVATLIAVLSAGILALLPGPNGLGSGGLILWPLFGATNQLLAGLAFLVIAFYLIRHRRPVWFLIPAILLMVVMPAWAMIHNIAAWYAQGKWLLLCIGIAVELLQAWLVIEGIAMWSKARGVLPAPPPSVESIRAGRSITVEHGAAP